MNRIFLITIFFVIIFAGRIIANEVIQSEYRCYYPGGNLRSELVYNESNPGSYTLIRYDRAGYKMFEKFYQPGKPAMTKLYPRQN